MAFEKNWAAVSPQAFTADGNIFGQITLANTAGFRVKQSAYLKNTAGATLPVQVKRVLSSTTLVVGLIDNNIASWKPLDISTWTVASGAVIGAESQDKKANPSPDDHYRAVYEADPVVADRVIFVDQYGNFYDANNPLPIAFDGTISIGDVVIHGTNGNTIEPNADGSINVNIINTPVAGNTVVNRYAEANAVVSGATTTVVQYTLPLIKTSGVLQRISVSGENIAKWTVFINAAQIDTRRTFYGSSLSEYFEFITGGSDGVVLAPGDQVTVKVLHNSPYVGDFEGRIQVLEIA
jgi:hypothetical protein